MIPSRFRLLAALLAGLILALPLHATPAGPPAPGAGPWPDSAMLPVTSPSLSPGAVTPRPLNLPGAPRLFLVGSDPLSRAWLARRAAQLERLGAVGLAVEVPDEQALAQLRATAPQLRLWPISGEDLARRLGLRHYPVLITGQGLEQ